MYALNDEKQVLMTKVIKARGRMKKGKGHDDVSLLERERRRFISVCVHSALISVCELAYILAEPLQSSFHRSLLRDSSSLCL